MNNLPLPISVIPRSSPAWLILFAPNVLRQPLQRSSSFLRRINRLKLIPHTTSRDRMKFRVENGMATVAVHPSGVRPGLGSPDTVPAGIAVLSARLPARR